MKPLRELLIGLSSILATALVVFGAASAGISEGLLSAVYSTEPVDELRILTILPGMPTARPRATQLLKVITLTPTAAYACPTPKEWQAYTVQPADTLEALAESRNTSVAIIMEGNCLVSPTLLPGTTLRLPKLFQPSATPAGVVLPSTVPTRCGPPRTWIRYTIQPLDTLTKLSYLYGVSIPELKLANCLTDSLIIAGQVLYVPNVATRTLSPTPTLPSATPTRTFTITFTPTRTFTRTLTPVYTKTFTPTITNTATKTATATPTATSTRTATPTPTRTSTSTPTRTP